MELKTARLTLLIDPEKKAAFERLCASQDLTPSQVVRQLVREYLARHGAVVPAPDSAAAPDAAAGAADPAAPAAADDRNPRRH